MSELQTSIMQTNGNQVIYIVYIASKKCVDMIEILAIVSFWLKSITCEGKNWVELKNI